MKWTYLVLIFLLVLGAYLNFKPHINYPYPFHVDEWTHFTYAQHLSDSTPLYFGGESTSLEYGFHVFLAVLNSLGVDYLVMFRFLPSLITILIGLSMFIMVRKHFTETAALFSVLFMMLLKSSVSLLGPMFLVPMALGLMFIPLALYLIESRLLFLIIAATIIMHPPSAIALLFLVNSYLISTWFFDKKFDFKLIKQQIIGITLASPLYLSYLLSKGHEAFGFKESFTGLLYIPNYFGYLITLIIIIGFIVIDFRKKYTFAIYSTFLLVLTVLYYRFNINILIFYERNLMLLFESFAIPFGAFFSYTASRFRQYEKILLVLSFVLLLVLLVPSKMESTGYVYQIINDKEYNEFLEFREVEGKKAVLDPWKAIAFSPLAGKEIYSRIPRGPNTIYLERNKEIFEFFNQSCSNETFLKENEIDIVVGC